MKYITYTIYSKDRKRRKQVDITAFSREILDTNNCTSLALWKHHVNTEREDSVLCYNIETVRSTFTANG